MNKYNKPGMKKNIKYSKKQEFVCPECGSTESWEIDKKKENTRRKCKACDHKFTPIKKMIKLKPDDLEEIAHFFGETLTAADAAYILKYNEKTIQRCYRILRSRLYNESEEVLSKLNIDMSCIETNIDKDNIWQIFICFNVNAQRICQI